MIRVTIRIDQLIRLRQHLIASSKLLRRIFLVQLGTASLRVWTHHLSVSMPVLVLRMDHHSALGVIRSLGRLGVHVYGVHPTSHTSAAHSKYCRGVFQWDLEKAPVAESIDFLIQTAAKIGARPLLLATNDESAIFISENSARLSGTFTFFGNSPELIRSLYNKREMYFLAKRLSIATAETVFPLSRQDVVDYCRDGQFPAMLKASDNIIIAKRNGTKMVIVHSAAELLRCYDSMEDPGNPTFMLQEYIPGSDDSGWMFNGFFDDDSECCFGTTARKIHQTPVYSGMTALGECVLNPEIESTTRRLMKAVRFKGIVDVDYRFDARDGSYKLLDVNPRLGATFRLFVGKDGMDVVRAGYLHATGQSIPPSEISIGRKWIVLDADVLSCLRYYRDGSLSVKEWIHSYRGIQEDAWFAADDPGPFLHMCGRFAARPFRKLFRRRPRRVSLPAVTRKPTHRAAV